MTDPMSRGELGPRPGQMKLDLLLVGDANRYFLNSSVQKFISTTGRTTLTVIDVKEVAVILAANAFDIVFMRVISTLTKDELQAIQTIRSAKKKNTSLLFVFVRPDNFKGCISEYGVDISFTEPLTLEKMNSVVKYWKAFFPNIADVESFERLQECGLHLLRPAAVESVEGPPEHGPHPQSFCSERGERFSPDMFLCSEQPRNDTKPDRKAPLPAPERNRKTSLLHSSKEKLRRERIKFCCEQLRTLLPYVKGRKSDVASVIEATVDYVKYVRETIPPAIMAQITECLQSTARFSKRYIPMDLFLPCIGTSQREGGVLTSAYSSMGEIQLLADQCLSVYPEPAAEGPLEEAVRGQSGSVSESSTEDLYEARASSPARPLKSFHTARYCPEDVPSRDPAARTNQNIPMYLPPDMPSASNLLPAHGNSVLCQTRPTSVNCLCPPGHELSASSQATSAGVLCECEFEDSDSDY